MADADKICLHFSVRANKSTMVGCWTSLNQVVKSSVMTSASCFLPWMHDDITLKFLSIGTPKTINFPFVPNWKLMVLGVQIFEHIVIRLLCAWILGHLKIINFTVWTNENFIIFGCPNTEALYSIFSSVPHNKKGIRNTCRLQTLW